jgi:hypothetical protein
MAPSSFAAPPRVLPSPRPPTTTATAAAEEGACLGQRCLVDVDLDFGVVAALLDRLNLFLRFGGVGVDIDLNVTEFAVDLFLPALGRPGDLGIYLAQRTFNPIRNFRRFRELKAL